MCYGVLLQMYNLYITQNSPKEMGTQKSLINFFLSTFLLYKIYGQVSTFRSTS